MASSVGLSPWPPLRAPLPFESSRKRLQKNAHCSKRRITWITLVKSKDESISEEPKNSPQPFTSEVLAALIVIKSSTSCRALLSSYWTTSITSSRFASLAFLNRHQSTLVESTKWTCRRLSYLLDLLLEKHPISYVYILAITCAIFVIIGGTCFVRFRTFEQKPGDSFWDAWACLCSSGTHLRERTFRERAIGILLAVCGLMFYSLLTSTLTAQFRLRMENLREGANFPVMEAGHTVICGTNSHLKTLLTQLNKAYELALRKGTAKSCKKTVVILSERSKKEVDEELMSMHKKCKALNILTRCGNLGSSESFQSVGAARASQIILLSRKLDAYHADADVVLSVLSMRPSLQAHPMKLIAEVAKPSTVELLHSLAGQKVLALQNLGSKLLVQCSRQHGLYDVYVELLDHGRQTISLTSQPELAGLEYHQVRRGFKDGVICGIIRDEKINFHPKDSLILQSSDMLIVIADKAKLSQKFNANLSNVSLDRTNVAKRNSKPLSKTADWSVPKKECIIVLGWKSSVRDIALEYDKYVGKGSQLVILAKERLDSKDLQLPPLRNLKVTRKEGNPLNEADLRDAILDMQSNKQTVPLTLVVISDEKWQRKPGSGKSDKQGIYALFLAQSVCNQLNVKVGSLVGELIDATLGKQVMSSHRNLTFIGTSELLGLVTAQVAENADLNGVWTELLNSWGNEIYVKDISLYMREGELVSFEKLSDRAVLRDEVAIGYRMNEKIVINPNPKKAQLAFRPGDSLIVICEYEYGNYQDVNWRS